MCRTQRRRLSMLNLASRVSLDEFFLFPQGLPSPGLSSTRASESTKDLPVGGRPLHRTTMKSPRPSAVMIPQPECFSDSGESHDSSSMRSSRRVIESRMNLRKVHPRETQTSLARVRRSAGMRLRM